MYKKILSILLVLAMVLCLCSCSSEEEEGESAEYTGSNVVYVYNYGDYIDPEVITMFEEETGIKVIYDVFDTNEEMYPVISSGSVRYDVVCPSEYMVEKMIQNGLLTEIDLNNVPNIEYMDETVWDICDTFDPGHRYAVPYTWGTVGILYNTRMIEEGEITSWSDLWKEEYFDEIMMMDSLRDIYMIPLKILGCSANSTDPDELRRATDLLIEQKHLVYKYATDAVRDFLLNESTAMGVIYSGEVLYCQEEDEDLQYVLPEEGSNVWFDNWVIPANCRSKENAEAWINFMCRPDIAFRTFEYIYYATPNTGAMEMIAEEYPEFMDNDAIFPDEEILDRCEIYHYLGPEADELYNNLWKEFKAY